MVDMKGIILYDYQLDMLRRIEDAFVTHQSVMVQMPTGTGKTVLLSEVVKSEERRAKEVKSEERRVKNPCDFPLSFSLFAYCVRNQDLNLFVLRQLLIIIV